MAKAKGKGGKMAKKMGTGSRRDEYMKALEKADQAADAMAEHKELLDLLVQDHGVDTPFEELAEEYANLTATESFCSRRKDELKPILREAMITADLKVVANEKFVVEVVASHKPRELDATKLVEEGVKLEIIEKCYIGGEEYKYVTVRRRKP